MSIDVKEQNEGGEERGALTARNVFDPGLELKRRQRIGLL